MKSRTQPAGFPCHVASSAFAEVLPETRHALAGMCREKRYGPGRIVSHEGESTDFIGCIRSGILRMQKTLADGRQHIVGLLFAGDIFGRIFDGPGEFSIEAATEVVVCAFDRARFETLMQSAPDLERAVLLNLLNELDRARDWMLVLSNQKIADRLAGFFLLLASRHAGNGLILGNGPEGLEIRIPISRADLAHLLGTRPESVSRAFHFLEDEGDIRILDPARIVLRDLGALAMRAGEDGIGEISRLGEMVEAARQGPPDGS